MGGLFPVIKVNMSSWMSYSDDYFAKYMRNMYTRGWRPQARLDLLSSFNYSMSDAPSSQSSRIAVVDDTDPSMVFVGTWSHDQGISGIATPYEEKTTGLAYNSTATSTIFNTSRFDFNFSGMYRWAALLAVR